MKETTKPEKPRRNSVHGTSDLTTGVVTSPQHKGHVVLSLPRIAIVVACAVVLITGGLYVMSRPSAKPVAKTENAVTKPKQNTAIKQPAVAGQLKTADATYLASPKLISDQQLFADTSALGSDCVDTACTKTQGPDPATIKYYQIGTTKSGSTILYIMTPTCGPDGCFREFALEKGGKYSILLATANSPTDAESEKQQYARTFMSNVALDTTVQLSGLDFPATVTVNGQTYNRRYSSGYGTFMEHGLSDIRSGVLGGSSVNVQPVTLGKVDSYTMYKVVTKDDPNFQVVENYATLGNLFTMPYDLPDPLVSSNNKAVDVDWQTGTDTIGRTELEFPSTSACGAIGYTLVKVANASQLTTVGVSANGQTLYQLPADSTFSQKVYSEDYAGGVGLGNASLEGLTAQQFMDVHGYALFKNALGEYVMVVRDDMFTGGGCAKPVVYLYPQKTINVSVKVDAQVVKSDPLYPTTSGWKNVLADPSGKLTYQGKNYDSLYWEGYGYGAYPDITNGTVVESGKAVATIKAQLKVQGLNAKEIADFVSYWQPRLPQTPYVRLTWFDTAQMSELAPLTVSPRPQTEIRVFLDFEGLQKPVKLAPQHFVTPVRQGFTVVEWGGLARNGLAAANG